MTFQPKDPSKDGHKNDQNSNHNKSHGLQPRQMSRRMGRSMNRFGSGEFSNTKLDSTVQAKMENAFQEDFSDVQVTKDSNEATQMGAQAFAQGNKIHFASGNYKPQSTEGQELIGHELAHVVQQKQGRVKATTQAKGAPVNDDPALENEADVMGKKAAGGEQSVVQKQSKSGEVQRQGVRNEDITYLDGLGRENTISGVNVIGEYFNVVRGNDGRYYKRNIAKIIKTSKDKWKEILKNANRGYQIYHQWVLGFLKANVQGLRSFPFVPNQAVMSAPNSGPLYCELYGNSSFESNDVLDFMEALYGVGESQNETNLPNGYNLEGGMVAERTFFPMMSEFVMKHQPILIKAISSQSQNSRMDNISSNITHLADEATPQGVFSVGKPEVAVAMIQSAYGSALSSAKSLINLSVTGLEDNTFERALDESDVIYNSGLIINNTLKAYEGIVDRINKNKETAFDVAWATIPFSKKIPDAAKVLLKAGAKNSFNSLFSTKHTNITGMKNEMKSNFGNLKEDLLNAIQIVIDSGLLVDYDILSLRFDSMKNTFDSGLDD